MMSRNDHDENMRPPGDLLLYEDMAFPILAPPPAPANHQQEDNEYQWSQLRIRRHGHEPPAIASKPSLKRTRERVDAQDEADCGPARDSTAAITGAPAIQVVEIKNQKAVLSCGATTPTPPTLEELRALPLLDLMQYAEEQIRQNTRYDRNQERNEEAKKHWNQNSLCEIARVTGTSTMDSLKCKLIVLEDPCKDAVQTEDQERH